MPRDLREDHGWRLNTRLVRGGLMRSGFDETAEALFLTSGYVYETAAEAEAAFKGEKSRYVYSRFANPTVALFETRLAGIEGASFCRATATGMAAVYAALAGCLRAGDRLVASRALFGSCQYICAEILPRFGVRTEFVNGTDASAWRRALSEPAACVFLETPSNPTLEVIDVAEVARLAHNAGARVVVDNVFATPLLQRPLDLGADIVVYSATKHMDGQGRTLGGAVLTNDGDWEETQLVPWLRHTGPALSPFNAWVLAKGLETLSLRVERHCRTALALAEWLVERPEVARVLYPGLSGHPQHALAMRQMSAGGTVVSLELPGDKAAAFRFLDALELIDISNNLGDAKTLATHPATTTHQRLSPEERQAQGITEGLVRISVGLEDEADLLADLEQALRAV